MVGAQAQRVFADAQAMLKKIIDGRWLTAHAVVGFWPAHSVRDDDIELYADQRRQQTVLTWYGLRQQSAKEQDADGQMRPSRCLADFVQPSPPPQNAINSIVEGAVSTAQNPENGIQSQASDYLGAFAVTAGLGVEKKEAQLLDEPKLTKDSTLPDRL